MKISATTGLSLAFIGSALWLATSCKTVPAGDARLRAKGENESPEVQTYLKNKPRECDGAKAPLFAKGNAEKIKPISIKGDLDNIFSGAGKGYAVVHNPSAATDDLKFVPVYLEQRGNSRRSNCEFKPLRVKFMLQPKDAVLRAKMEAEKHADWTVGVTPDAHAKILADMAAKNLPSDKEKIQFYFDELAKLTAGKGTPPNGFKQDKDQFFSQMGDDVKLVTHCGKSSWGDISGVDYPAQRDRLLYEFFIYRILNELKTTVIKTSALDVTYVKSNAEAPMVIGDGNSAVGFFRESKEKMASRCKLLGDKPAANGSLDTVSRMQTDLINKLLVNGDSVPEAGHNTEWMYDDKGNTFFSPYDFDLSGVVTDKYGKNFGPILQKADAFKQYLKNYDSNETMIAQVMFFLGKLDKIKEDIANAEKLLSPTGEGNGKKLSAWMDLFAPILKDYVERNRPNKTAYITGIEGYIEKHKKKDNAPVDGPGNIAPAADPVPAVARISLVYFIPVLICQFLYSNAKPILSWCCAK